METLVDATMRGHSLVGVGLAVVGEERRFGQEVVEDGMPSVLSAAGRSQLHNYVLRLVVVLSAARQEELGAEGLEEVVLEG